MTSGSTAITCTITNTRKGTLTVNKTVINDNNGTAVCSDFSFSVDGGPAIPFEADCSNDVTVSAGTHSVTETAVTGYSTTYANCTNVAVPAGGTNTCTITNDDMPATNGMLADVASSDADFRHIDGFDVLFSNSSGGLKKLAATTPGTFHYELNLQNETGSTVHHRGQPLPPTYRNGVAISDRNGASVTVIITIPSLPTTPGMPVPASALQYTDISKSAFKTDGNNAVRAHPDDRSQDSSVDVSWTATAPGGNCFDSSLVWTAGQPPNDTLIKCIKVTGFEIPKHGTAHVQLNLEFAPKGTDGWAANASTAFRAGFAFKSQTQITFDDDFPIVSLRNMTFSGNDVAGLTGVGEQLTAIGGFVFDQNGQGIGASNTDGMNGATIRIYNTAPSTINRCTTNGEVAEYSVDSDGFYFIRNGVPAPSVNVATSTGNTLPTNIQYYVMVCQVAGVPSAYWPASYIDHKLGSKEFEEENFYVSNPTHLGWSVQPINGNRKGVTMYAVQVALLDQWNNVVVDNTTKITLSKGTGTGTGTLSGTLTKTMVNGYAAFTDLKISAAGSYSLLATDSTGTGPPHPFAPVQSNTFTVTN